MEPRNTPAPPAYQLPADIHRHVVGTVSLALLSSPDESAEDRRRRNRAAMDTIAALQPADLAEADLAVQFVVASEQWMQCLRLVQAPGTTPERAMKWRDEAIKMMRLARSALKLLLSVQKTRRDPALAAERERNAARATQLMTAALASLHPTKPELN